MIAPRHTTDWPRACLPAQIVIVFCVVAACVLLFVFCVSWYMRAEIIQCCLSCRSRSRDNGWGRLESPQHSVGGTAESKAVEEDGIELHAAFDLRPEHDSDEQCVTL